ncbi:DUF5694 domain-containing protein [Hymenobacter cellulosivorans]|uniref:DUF5694 domain-containing protein n=1 Tax=Hymenobacter cellulosivorans TaxID=2932249 RepID=A0ABY4FFX4_9BACT|nr:DUF5694 domain-containing protein [Hymenobacter cellulosivorans]UOQ55585.1 DUF5694 domain-containing protein [Hymenobacter cellulosivorans]
MKPLRVFLLLLLFPVLALLSFGPRRAAKPARAQVMILGSYHMGNPGADLVNMQADDVTTLRRQQELQKLAEKLARFRPTKICLEWAPGTRYDSLVQVRYRQYQAGTYQLKRNEIDQIGFRLAKMLGHERVYGIDAPGRFEFGELMAYAQRHGQDGQLKRQVQSVDSMLKADEQVLLKTPLDAYFRQINHPALHRLYHDWYLRLLHYGTPQEPAGSRLVADYYERNIRIVANLMQVAPSPQERVLVVYGNGHTSFLKNILANSSEYDLVEAYDFLK